MPKNRGDTKVTCRPHPEGGYEVLCEMPEELAERVTREAEIYGLSPGEFLHRLFRHDMEREKLVIRYLEERPATEETFQEILSELASLRERLFTVQH
jgi:hypothetical protein